MPILDLMYNEGPLATTPVRDEPIVSLGRVLLAGVIAGLADALFALGLQVYYAGRFAPADIFRGIASGLLGPAAREGGAAAAALGVALHFGFAFFWVLLYATAYRLSPWLRRAAARPLGAIALGFAFGAIVWLGMNYVAKPIGGIAPTRLLQLYFLVMTLGHGVVVGLPTVLLVRAAGWRSRHLTSTEQS